MRYFQDDDNVGLKEMVRREKMSSAQDQNALYSRMAAKVRGNVGFLLFFCIRFCTAQHHNTTDATGALQRVFKQQVQVTEHLKVTDTPVWLL